MEILYRSVDKSPSDGDVKILKSGKIFFRAQRIYNGMYVVSNGQPCYEWYPENNEKILQYQRDYKDKSQKLFYSKSGTKTQKTRIVKFDFTNESDRLKYEQLTGVHVKSDTTIKTAKLQVMC